MNRYLERLQPYPFEKLTALKAGVEPPASLSPIALSIGEPKHPPPSFVLETLAESLGQLASYPLTKGLPALREAIATWATLRFHLEPDTLTAEHHVLPVAGTREALFSFTQACVNASLSAKVVMPNPFYQIYEGATLLAGAKPVFLNCLEANAYTPDFDSVPAHIWADCELLFICSPGNPTGSVMDVPTYQKLITLADQYDFVIASDECYSELYFDEDAPPPGLLQACAEMGRHDFARCVVFHSLSKRSNLPGLRSGFVAGDATILKRYLHYRTYEGCALPVPTQQASVSAWQDETHVIENRALYRIKFAQFESILGDVLPRTKPQAGFYYWAKTPIDDCEFAKQLYATQNVTVLPGQFLARPDAGVNPGKQHVRMALVATVEECEQAAKRIREFVVNHC